MACSADRCCNTRLFVQQGLEAGAIVSFRVRPVCGDVLGAYVVAPRCVCVRVCVCVCVLPHTDTHIYACTASLHRVKLLLGPPGKPGSPTVTGRKGTYLILKWGAPAVTGGAAITRYTLVWDEGDVARPLGSFATAYRGADPHFKVRVDARTLSHSATHSQYIHTHTHTNTPARTYMHTHALSTLRRLLL